MQCRDILWKKSLRDQLDDDVNHVHVQFPHAARVEPDWGRDHDIREGSEIRFRVASQCDHRHSQISRDHRGIQHVHTRSARADGQQAVARLPVAHDPARVDLVVAEVVGHATEMADITDGLSSKASTIASKPPREFLRKVDRITHGATTAAGVDAATRSKCVSENCPGAGDRRMRGGVVEQLLKSGDALSKGSLDVLDRRFARMLSCGHR